MIAYIDNIVRYIDQNFGFSITVFIVIMLFFAWHELASFKQKTFKDCKPLIISLGVVGTFIGIFCGLWNFNTDDIKNSVPALLKGLKLAFTTSIVGMFIAIVLSAIENFRKKTSIDTSEILNTILAELKKPNSTDTSETLKAILDEQKIANKNSSMILESIKHSRSEAKDHFKVINESVPSPVHRVLTHCLMLNNCPYMEDSPR